MRDQFELATTVPHDESCVQLGSENYEKFSMLEAQTLREQIFRKVGNPPAGCRINIIRCPHDFGTYLDLAVIYDDESEENVKWMLECESKIPFNWDEESLKKLREENYPI